MPQARVCALLPKILTQHAAFGGLSGQLLEPRLEPVPSAVDLRREVAQHLMLIRSVGYGIAWATPIVDQDTIGDQVADLPVLQASAGSAGRII